MQKIGNRPRPVHHQLSHDADASPFINIHAENVAVSDSLCLFCYDAISVPPERGGYECWQGRRYEIPAVLNFTPKFMLIGRRTNHR